MIVRCEECFKVYDDIYRLTFCPHRSFSMHTIFVRPNGTEVLCKNLEELDEEIKNQALRR